MDLHPKASSHIQRCFSLLWTFVLLIRKNCHSISEPELCKSCWFPCHYCYFSVALCFFFLRSIKLCLIQTHNNLKSKFFAVSRLQAAGLLRDIPLQVGFLMSNFLSFSVSGTGPHFHLHCAVSAWCSALPD